jgi:hypothetical protein
MPAKDGGIVPTFPHQEYNASGLAGRPWREGKLCLDSPVQALGRHGLSPEPCDDAEARLVWHVQRAVAWVNAAAHERLLDRGEPFEIPRYPNPAGQLTVIHDESAASFPLWLTEQETVGRVVLQPLAPAQNRMGILRFETFSGRIIREAAWRHLPEATDAPPETGTWWRWPAPIVLAPWQVPQTWDDLRYVGKHCGVDVEGMLRAIARQVRGQKAQTLLCGYGIPRRIGETPSEMYWQGILLPELTAGGKPRKGFRNNEIGLWYRDRCGAFGTGKRLAYLHTENWHPDRLEARGRLNRGLRDAKVVLLGVGALGSAVAEILVRGGTRYITLIDHDTLAAGNLVRHTLTLTDLGRNKAIALTERLQALSPYATAVGKDIAFPQSKSEAEALLQDAAVVIDCTASDQVLASLGTCWWPIPRRFVSLSLGLRAQRLFAFLAAGNAFPVQEFRDSMRPWLEDEQRAWQAHGEVLEGAGCWSPLFPARYDDIMLGAATATKLMEQLAAQWPQSPQLVIFEQEHDHAGFMGYRRVSSVITAGAA